MKKIMLSLGLMLGALTLTNCSNEIDENINTNTDGVAFELTAAIDANRVETDSYSTAWVAGDAINLHYAVAGETTYKDNGKFTIAEEDLANGRFTGTLNGELTAGTSYDWFAFYPYSSYIKNPTGSSYYRLWQQTQNVLCDDMSHLTSDASGNWSNAPLYGVATVEAGEPVAITMKQLGTMLRFNIGNSSSEDIVVESVKFATTSQRITGSYKVNYTGETPVVTKSDDTHTFFDVTLDVQDELFIEAGTEAGDASQIFAAVAPFTAPAGEVLTITVTTDKGVYETTKIIAAATEFKAGVVNTINVTVEVVAEIIKEFPYTETFADNLGDFTIDDVAVGSLSTIWKYDTYGYMKGSGYNAGAATEGWLISPYVDLTGAANPVLRFDHAGNFFGSQANMKNAVSVYVREADGEWAALTIPVYPNGTSWDFVNSDDIALSAYIGKTVQFGFKYTSPASGSIGTWEIKNFNVCEAPFSMSATAPAELPNTAGTGSFDLTVKNAEGYTFTAALKDDSQTWISNIAVASNTVTFDVAANTGNARIAAIVVTATNGTNTETIEVAISQAASASAVQPVTETLDMPTIFNNEKTNLTDGQTYTWGDFKVTFTQKNNSISNYSGGTTGHLRWYKNDVLKFAHKDGYKITKIVYTATGSNYAGAPTADSGNITISNLTMTWIGEATAVTLTASGSQVRFTQIQITYIPEGDDSGDEPSTPIEPVQLVMSDVTCSNAEQSENSLTFTWSAVDNATAYEIYFDSASKGTVTTTSYTATGLTAGSSHVIAVKAVGDGTNYTTSEAKTCTASTKAASGSVSADDTITFGSLGISNATVVSELTFGDAKISFDKSTGGTAPTYYTSGSAVRIYKSNKFTISSERTIAKVEFSFAGASYDKIESVDTGSYSGGTWTGSANSIVFQNNTADTSQTRITSIKVTYAD